VSPRLERLLEEHRPALLAWVQRHAGALLRKETAEDLSQLVCVHALEHEGSFRYEGDEAFRAWLLALARSCLGDRRDYWNARRRRPDRLLHLTSADASSPGAGAVREPPSRKTGPATSASRKEQIALAAKALSLLLPRDGQLVRWTAEDVPLAEQAERLGISYDATERARLRALERYRQAFALLVRKGAR
jgi:RNA polymerase sigma factor (sigma-70 family)